MGKRWSWLAATAVVLMACSGIPDDVNNVPVATDAAAVPATSVGGTASIAPIASALPASSLADDALWDTLEVIDGDTIRVSGPDGEQTVRMIGINAPERGECFYDDATAALRFSLGDRDVRLVRDVSEVDQYGRLLRYVELPDGTDVGADLVEGGYARSHHYEPDLSRSAEYDELQSAAEANGAGLWAANACGAPGASDVSIAIDGQYDAPGDDNLNLNQEWVRLTNAGTTTIDLSGWHVADESSSHRYQFDDLTLAPGASVTLFTGCGSDTDTQRYWCNEDSAVWNNGGDTVFVQDPSGNTVVTETYRD